MQLEAISQAIQAYYNCSEIDDENPSEAYRDIAMDIKKEFDKKYKGCWHCIVGIYLHLTQGENFGSFVTHENKHFIFFDIDKHSFLLFKSA